MDYKYITETFFQWTVNTGNYSSLNNPKGANLCLKCTKKYVLAAGSARSRWAYAFPHYTPLAAMGAYF